MLQFYKPNKSVKGSAASFSLNSKKGSVFVQIIKQTGYDEAKRLGSFKDGKQVSIQLNQIEIGAIIDVLEHQTEFKTVHKTEKFTTGINFTPYIKDGKQLGYGLSVNRSEGENKDSWLIGFNFHEAVVVREWLKFALEHIFTADYSADKKKAEEYLKKNEGKQEQKREEPTPKQEPEDEIIL